MATKKTTTTAKKAAHQCCGGCCDKPCAEKRGIKETVEKVKEIASKAPAFLVRMKRELEKLLDLIAKAEAALNTLSVFTARDAKAKTKKALLQKQVKAMKAYADALRARIADAEADL